MFQRPLESGRALAIRALQIRVVAELAAALTVLDAAGGSLLAAALAYQALFGLLAGLTFAGGLVGWAFTDPVRRDEAVAAIATAVPGLATVARDGVIALASGGGLLSLVGLAGAAWAASNVYDVLDDAIDRVMPGGRARGLLHRRRRGLLAIALVAAAGLLVLSVRLALPIATLNIDGTVAAAIFGVTEFAVGLALLAVGILAVYRFVPVAPPSVRAATLPALAAAVAIRLAAELFAALAPILVRNLQIFGVVVSLLALLVWLSWACRILLLGAAWAAVRRDRAVGLDSPAT